MRKLPYTLDLGMLQDTNWVKMNHYPSQDNPLATYRETCHSEKAAQTRGTWTALL